MCFHSGNQLTGTERFCHIVIRSQTQTADLINIVLFGRDHDHRIVLYIPDLTADLKSVHFRKHQVQNEQIIISLQRLLKPHVTSVLNLHLKAAQLQVILFKVGNCLLVFNN